MSSPNPSAWSARCAQLVEDPHLIEQVERLMEPLRLIRGTCNVPSFEETLRSAAQLVAVLELSPELSSTANVGGILAMRGPMEGYSLLVHATDVYVSRLSPYREAAEHWRNGQEARYAARAADQSAPTP